MILEYSKGSAGQGVKLTAQLFPVWRLGAREISRTFTSYVFRERNLGKAGTNSQLVIIVLLNSIRHPFFYLRTQRFGDSMLQYQALVEKGV